MSGTFGEVFYFEEFSTVGDDSVLNRADWEVYDSVGNAGYGVRSPSAVSVVADPTSTSGGNVLRLDAFDSGGQHYHAGVKLLKPRTYMQAELRVAVDDDPDQVTSGVVIFWPVNDPEIFPPADNPEGPWPAGGELDYWETFNNRDTRTPTQTYIHRLDPAAITRGPPYTSADDQVPVSVTHTGVDQSDWHKIVCSWTPDELFMEIDDGPKILITDDPANIPDWDMELTMQLDAWSNTPPTGLLRMRIDYVLLREWVPPGGLPEGTLDVDDSNIVTHQTMHDLWNLVLEGGGQGDALEVLAVNETTNNVVSVAPPQVVKPSQLLTIPHTSSGPVSVAVSAETKAVVIEASAPITGLALSGDETHGEIFDLPFLIKASTSISVTLPPEDISTPLPPATLASGQEFPFRVSRLG